MSIHSSVTNWSLEALPNGFHVPPLPLIDNAEIESRVFTHKSFNAARRDAMSLDVTGPPDGDYSQLATVGDAILGSGVLTHLKAQLAKNATLALLSDKYNMSDRLRAHEDQSAVLRANAAVRASLFEAYIAGVYSSHEHDHGRDSALERVANWLYALLRPLIVSCIALMQAHVHPPQVVMDATTNDETQYGVQPFGDPFESTDENDQAHEDLASRGASMRLNELCIGRLRIGIPDYKDVEFPMQTWTVTCSVDLHGHTWSARATRSTKRQATTVAAWKVLHLLGE
ncbi:hypothetical protein BCR39DRAFT_588447 [Naematelia encephala]|uniref:RNase III domain-containing protein n=1 Tax=Naematelia encephala TaxID=71784 RepID=A0A1Y2B2U1_9TREE|nr:hypothetical protein BCR39DRAFT_588447 [Naematelia encephala]